MPDAQTGTEPLARARSLVRDFDGRRIVGPLDFQLPAGRRTALVGPNGCGKSTVLRCLAGTLRPTTGVVTVAGHAAGARAARSLVGVSLSQERSFDLRLSGHVNLVLFARLRGLAMGAARKEALALEEELELQELVGKPVSSCSTGMTQQLSFARSLLGGPRLLLLDEPTRSLDDGARDRLWGALERRPEVGVLIATHREDDIERCDGVIELGP